MTDSTTAQNGSQSAEVAASAPQTDATARTDVTITNDRESHDTTHLSGDQVSYDASDTRTTHTAGTWPAEADEHVREIVENAEDERQRIENTRANHRNFNRVMTLLFTLVAGLIITFGLYHSWFGAWGPTVGPYSFVITVTGDFFLTLYALLRHY